MRTFDALKIFVDGCVRTIDIIVISETWFRSNELCVYELPGYKSIHSCRKSRRGGGLSIYIRKPCTVEEIVITNEEINSVYVKLKNYRGFGFLKLLGVYRQTTSINKYAKILRPF